MKTNAKTVHGTDKIYTELKSSVYTGLDGCGKSRFRALHLSVEWHKSDLYKVTFGWIEEFKGENYLHERVSLMDIHDLFNVFNIL